MAPGAEGEGVMMTSLWDGGMVLATLGVCRSRLGPEVSAKARA